MIWIIVILSPIVFLFIAIGIRIIIDLMAGRRFPKKITTKKKVRNILIRLYWDFPKALINDMFNKNPGGFQDYGFHLICGEQGSGKSITLAYLLNKYKDDYPLSKVRTNFYYSSEDGHISHWKDLIFKNNGEFGQIEVLDEVQNWFSSNQSKDFPVEMIQEITQQRKQRKVIFGTAQVFSRVAKPIREQVNFLYLPITAFGCFTIVRVIKPKIDENGSIKAKQLRKIFFFIHNDNLRNSFDTFKKVESLAKSGFYTNEHNESQIININVTSKRKK